MKSLRVAVARSANALKRLGVRALLQDRLGGEKQSGSQFAALFIPDAFLVAGRVFQRGAPQVNAGYKLRRSS